MRIVAFADVLGNPHAAQAILHSAKRLGEVDLVCLGNAVGRVLARGYALEGRMLRPARVVVAE